MPDVTLCSNACRARQTLEGIAGSADTGRVIFLDKLYTEDATGYLQLIQENGLHGSMLVVGHNPMIEDRPWQSPALATRTPCRRLASAFRHPVSRSCISRTA